MKRFLALTLLLSSLPGPAVAASPKVEVANGNWSYLPQMNQSSNFHLSSKAIYRIHELAAQGKCSLPGFSKGLLDFDMSFAAHFHPNGTLNRLVMPKLGCPEAEGILGGILLKMVGEGEYRPDGSNENGWYRGQLSFTVSG